MKKTFLYFAVIFAVMFAGVSCEKIEQPKPQSPVDNSEIEEKEGTYSVTFECSMAEDDATRTEFHDNGDGTQGIWWSVGDEINIYQMRYKNDTDLASQVSKQTVPEKDKLDKFSCKITNFTEPYRYPVYYWALFPAGSVKSHRTSFTGEEVYYAQMNVPAEQSPSADTFAPKADVLVSKYITSSEQQTTFNLQFRRVVALGKMRVVNLPSEESIESIKFENTQSYLAGDGFYELEGTGTRDYVPSETGSKSITVNYPEESQVKANTPAGMTAYFTCRAFTLAAEKEFTVTVTTYAGEIFTKVIKIPASLSGGLKFEEGRGTQFTVNMSEVPSQYEASVTTNGSTTYHETINAALSATQSATSEATVKLRKSCKMESSYDVNKNVTLDLNGFTLTQNVTQRLGVTTGGTLTIEDTDPNGKGTITQSGKAHNTFNISAGTLIIRGGSIEQPSDMTKSVAHINITDGASLTVEGGKISSTYNSISFSSSETLTITDGEITSTNLNAVNLTGGSATISGGKFKGNTNDINVTNGTMSISGGYFNKQVNNAYIADEYGCVSDVETTYPDYPYTIGKYAATLQVNNNIAGYNLIKDAFEAANNAAGASTLTLRADNRKLTTAFSIGKDITLDLGKYTLSADGTNRISVVEGGTLTIKSENNLGKMVQLKTGNPVISSAGTLNINGGVIQTAQNSEHYAVYVTGGAVNISGGQVLNGGGQYTLYLKDCSATISGGEICGSGYHTVCVNNSNLSISGGNIKCLATGSDNYALYITKLNSDKVVDISGGHLYSMTRVIWASSELGSIKVTGDAFIYSAKNDGTETSKVRLFRRDESSIEPECFAGYYGCATENTDNWTINITIKIGYAISPADKQEEGLTYKRQVTQKTN